MTKQDWERKIKKAFAENDINYILVEYKIRHAGDNFENDKNDLDHYTFLSSTIRSYPRNPNLRTCEYIDMPAYKIIVPSDLSIMKEFFEWVMEKYWDKMGLDEKCKVEWCKVMVMIHNPNGNEYELYCKYHRHLYKTKEITNV